MWDLIFTGLTSSRDENMVATLMRWMMQVAMNFTLMMFGTLMGFCYWILDLIKSYNPGWLLGGLAFAGAVTAATSLVLSFLVTLYAGAAGTVYVAAKASGANFRLQEGGQGGRPRRQHLRQQQQRWQ
jgi:amino acid transporter